MGVDLTLIPVESDSGAWGYGHSLIEFGGIGREVDAAIRPLKTYDPPPKFSTFKSHVPDGSKQGESCYGVTTETPYGEPIRCVRAGDFVKAVDPLVDWERGQAAIAYLGALDPKALVALYWH